MTKIQIRKETRYLNDLIFDKELYPRIKHSPALVERYAQNLEHIEMTGNYIHISENHLILDGRHRHLAYQTVHNDKNPEIPVYVHGTADRLEAFRIACFLNSQHGDQLTREEKRMAAIRLFESGDTLDQIAAKLSCSKRFAQEATQAVRDARQAAMDREVYGLWLACYTEHEIAKVVGLPRMTISDKIATFDGIVPEYYSVKSRDFDQDSEFKHPFTNIWSYAAKTNKVEHFGNSEQRILDNLLYNFTDKHGIVVDPFAGGGATIDVCEKRLRRYWASDLTPIKAREGEIRTHDITEGVPPLNKRWADVQLTYLDPPYWRQAQGEYSDKENDLSNMPLEEFTQTLAKFIKAILRKQKQGAVAMLMQPTHWRADNREFTDHVFDIINAVKAKVWHRISVPYSTEQLNAQMVEWAKAQKDYLVLTRELVIWRVSGKTS